MKTYVNSFFSDPVEPLRAMLAARSMDHCVAEIDAAWAAFPPPVVLLYQNRNNSISGYQSAYKLKDISKDSLHHHLEWDPNFGPRKGTHAAPPNHLGYADRKWRAAADKLVERTSTNERKTLFQFLGNAESFIRFFGLNHCAFWTITDPDGLTPHDFNKRWNSFLTNEGRFILAFIRVTEPQKNGRPHYHILVAVSWDLEPDKFDWKAYRRANSARRIGDNLAHARCREQYVASTPPQTRELWSSLREALPNYGFGRSEFLPIRTSGAKIASYMGKCLKRGNKFRGPEWKGCRRVEYSRRGASQWKTHHRQFSFTTSAAKVWRARVAAIANAVKAADLDELSARLGKRWAFKLRNEIINLPEVDFHDWLEDGLQRFCHAEPLDWRPLHW
jgi:hypothetical protein